MAIFGVPRVVPGAIERLRISALLEADGPIVVVQAPPGFGKTTELAAWAQRTSRDGVWIRARDGLSSSEAFVEELGELLLAAGLITELNPFAGVGDARDARLSGAPRADVWSLALRGLRRLDRDIVVVVDDADVLTDEAREGVESLVAQSPNLLLRLAVAGELTGAEHLQRARGYLTVVGRAELALTAEERARMASGAPAPEVASPGLLRLALAAESAGAGGSLSLVEAALAGRDLAPDTLTVLARTIFAEVVDLGLARRLSGVAEPRAALDELEERGFGAWLTTERTAFRYVPFLRDQGEAIARERLPAAQVREIESVVARDELARGAVVPALRRAVRIEDWEVVDDVVRGAWPELLRAADDVLDVFRTVSLLTLRRRPITAALLAVAHSGSEQRRLRTLELLGIALAGARRLRKQGTTMDRMTMRMIETMVFRVMGNLTQATASAREAIAMLEELPPEERAATQDVNTVTFFTQTGITFLYAGDGAAAAESFRRAVAAEREPALRQRLHALALQAGLHALSGDIPEAETLLREARDIEAPDTWADSYQSTFLHVAAAYAALERGNTTTARERARVLDATMPWNEHWAHILPVQAMADLLAGRADQAAELLDAAFASASGWKAVVTPTIGRLRPVQTLVDLARGDVRAAAQAASRIAAGPAQAQARARIALTEGDPEAALKALALPLPENAWARVRAEHAALRAASLAMLDQNDEHARRALDRLDAFLGGRGLMLPLLFVPRPGLEAMAAVAARSGADGQERLRAARARSPLSAGPRMPRLSRREQEVAREILRFDSNDEIAAVLGVSTNTVKTHVRALYRKLGVRNRREARRLLTTFTE